MQAFSENSSTRPSSVVVVLGTGGTIAGTAASPDDVLGYTAAQVGVDVLLGGLPGVQDLACQVQAEQVAQVDSKDMGFAVWVALAERITHHLSRAEVTGVVVTHGTDTIEETAFFLHCVVPKALLATKAVVLTCAMRPATATDADGPRNLLDALRLASSGAAQNLCGVMMVCAGVVHSPLHVQKVHPTRLDPFESGDEPPLGLVSPAGVFQPLERGATVSAWNALASLPVVSTATLRRAQPWPRVEVVLNHAGASGAPVEAMLAHPQGGSGKLRGIVVAGTGNGSVHGELLAALSRARAAGVRVVRASRCANGHIQAVAGHALPEISVLSPVKARIALMLELMQADAEGGLQRGLNRPEAV